MRIVLQVIYMIFNYSLWAFL